MHRPGLGCLEHVLCINKPYWSILIPSPQRSFVGKLERAWITACRMRRTKGSFQKERGADRPEAYIFHQLPSVPRIIPAGSLHFQLRFCSFFSSFFPSKLKNSLAIRKKNIKKKHCRLQICDCTRSYLSKSNTIKSCGTLALGRCSLPFRNSLNSYLWSVHSILFRARISLVYVERLGKSRNMRSPLLRTHKLQPAC